MQYTIEPNLPGSLSALSRNALFTEGMGPSDEWDMAKGEARYSGSPCTCLLVQWASPELGQFKVPNPVRKDKVYVESYHPTR